MTTAPRSYRMPSLWFTAFCVVVTGTALALAYWQHRRAQLKDDLQQLAAERAIGQQLTAGQIDTMPAAELSWRPARVVGTYAAQEQFLIDNRIHAHQPGLHVITPLALANDKWILVNRGWLPAPPTRAAIKAPTPPAGVVTVAGLLIPDAGEVFELAADQGDDGIWQNLVIERWNARSGKKSAPVVLLAAMSAPGLTPVAAQPDYRADRSRGYRLQWLALALVVVGGWIAVALRP